MIALTVRVWWCGSQTHVTVRIAWWKSVTLLFHYHERALSVCDFTFCITLATHNQMIVGCIEPVIRVVPMSVLQVLQSTDTFLGFGGFCSSCQILCWTPPLLVLQDTTVAGSAGHHRCWFCRTPPLLTTWALKHVYWTTHHVSDSNYSA